MWELTDKTIVLEVQLHLQMMQTTTNVKLGEDQIWLLWLKDEKRFKQKTDNLQADVPNTN